MRKKSFKEYNIDIKYELKTYNHVGFDCNRKSFFRRCMNRKERKYKVCNKYSDWEKHIEQIISKNILNYNDMVHWLYRRKRTTYILSECIKAILVPVYVVFLSLLMTLYMNISDSSSVLIMIIVLSLMILVLPVIYLRNAMQEINFYKDIIKLIKKFIKDTSH
jgi:hypothetical protein